jgi:hypothetical protein
MQRAKNKTKSPSNVKQKFHKVKLRSIPHPSLELTCPFDINAQSRDAAGIRNTDTLGSTMEKIARRRAEIHV